MSTGNPKGVRLTYSGRIAEMNTQLIRNAGLAGVLNRSLSQKANVVNALQIASARGLSTAESHLKRTAAMDSVRLELESDHGVVALEGAVVLGKPRLLQVDGIYCEAPLGGHLAYLRNRDVPGVIGHVGTVLGRNSINIANFSLGRQNGPARPGEVMQAVALVETDGEVPESVLAELRENPAVLLARSVEFSA
ncbi:MAG: ACT domain-containing protein [Acidobacteria bacterium]|nr:ACT domain-containing protein [Acidobacteriota bacterium]